MYFSLSNTWNSTGNWVSSHDFNPKIGLGRVKIAVELGPTRRCILLRKCFGTKVRNRRRRTGFFNTGVHIPMLKNHHIFVLYATQNILYPISARARVAAQTDQELLLCNTFMSSNYIRGRLSRNF